MTNLRSIDVTIKHIRHYRRKRRAKHFAYLIFQVFQYIVITAAALIMAFNGYYGQYVVGIYGLIVLLPKLWPFSYGKLEDLVDSLGSQQVFIIALLILISIPVFTLLGKSVIAQNAAVYVFELLAIGVITATIELWHSKKSVGSNQALQAT